MRTKDKGSQTKRTEVVKPLTIVGDELTNSFFRSVVGTIKTKGGRIRWFFGIVEMKVLDKTSETSGGGDDYDDR